MSEGDAVPLLDGITGREQAGEGDKVLWLHGYTLDSRSWREMWSRLPGWHHVGIDMPGHGKSDPITPGMNLQVLARKLGEYCREADIRHVVALSFGTQTATQMGIEFPSFFDSIVLAAPSLAGGPLEAEVGRAYSQLFQLYFTGHRGVELKEAWMECVAWKGVESVPGLVEELGALVEQHPWAELANGAMMHFFQPEQPAEALRRIQSPVLVMVGELEMPAYRECADILERNLPDVRRVELPQTHHLCMLESPELAAPPIEQHLREFAKKSKRLAH